MANEEHFVDVINIIADKLGIAATEIFNIFVGAQVTIGTLRIIGCVLACLLGIMTYFIITKVISDCYTYRGAVKKLNPDSYDYDDKRMPIIIIPVLGGLLSLILWSIIFHIMASGILRILCPEYAAISEIIGLII
jgi:hypothetical protein